MRVRIGFGARATGIALALWGLSVAMLVASGPVVGAAGAAPNVLLTIDQNRAAVVDRIVGERGDAMLQSGAGITSVQLRAMLMQLRADQLLAANMAGTASGVRDVLARALVGAEPINPALLQQESSSTDGATLTKAIGDGGDDVVYTPVTPCRLVETRGTFPAVYRGNGPSHAAFPFNANEIRTYTVQGGNSVCLSQLPSGLGAAAVQLQVFGIPIGGASGDIEILAQGSTFGSTATEVYIGSIAFNTVSTTAKINTTNNEISVQVRGGKANLAMDVVGYFRTPGNYHGDSASGSGATVGGGDNNSAPGADSTIAGGDFNIASGISSSVLGGELNTASGDSSVVLGGESNTASGHGSIAAGANAIADKTDCVVFALWNTTASMNCNGYTNVFRIGANLGLTVDYFSQVINGGSRWVDVGNFSANQTISTWTGAFLSDGGTWTNNSDRDSKVEITSVDSASILAKVASLPISTWRYKVEEGQVHLGPMAQDFHAAFGLGMDNKHIATIDEDGVALAAIQALYLADRKRDEEGRERERKKDEQIQTLERRLEALESQHALPAATP